jgi:hypothetical protein
VVCHLNPAKISSKQHTSTQSVPFCSRQKIKHFHFFRQITAGKSGLNKAQIRLFTPGSSSSKTSQKKDTGGND